MKMNFQFFPLFPTAKYLTTTTLVVSFVILLGFFPQSSNGLSCMKCDTVKYVDGPPGTTVGPTDETCIDGTNTDVEACVAPNDKSCVKVVAVVTPQDTIKPATFIGRRCTDATVDNPDSQGIGCYSQDAGKLTALAKKASRSLTEVTDIAAKAGSVSVIKLCICEGDGCNKDPGLEIVAMTTPVAGGPPTGGPGPGPETPETPEPPAIPDKSMILSVGPKIILTLSTLSLSYVYIVLPK